LMMAWRRIIAVITPPPYKSGDRGF